MAFKNGKFKKTSAFLMSTVSLFPVLFQNVKEAKVFANGIPEKMLSMMEFLCRFIFKKFDNCKEIVKDIIEYIKKRYNEAENASKEVHDEHGSTQKDNKNLGNPEENTGEEGAEKKGESKKQSSLGQDDEDTLKKCKDICFNEQDLANIEEEPVCSGNLGLVLGKRLEKVDEKNYEESVEAFKHALRHFEWFFKRIDTDCVEFLKDERGNQVLFYRGRDETGKVVDEESLSFCVNSKGSLFLKFRYKREVYLVPARMFFSGNSENSRHIDGAHFDEFKFLDPKAIISFFFEEGVSGASRIDDLEKLLEIFEKKDSSGLLAAHARKSISLFKTAELCAKGAIEQKKREYGDIKEKLSCEEFEEQCGACEERYLKNIFTAFVKAKLPENCSPQDRENYEYLKKATLDYVRYVGIKIEGVLQDENNSNEGMSTSDLTNMDVESVQG